MFSIIILNYNGLEYLPACLAAVRAQRYAGGWEIIVVNNGSSDGSLQFLKAQPDVRLIEPGVNSGFSRGQNLGIRAASGEFVLCLNFDCMLEPDFLENVARVFRSDSQVGSVSGKLRKLVDGRKTGLIDSTGIAFGRCVPADRGEWTTDRKCFDEAGAVFGASGAAACYRRSALEDVRFEDEYFDEDMFIYCEDIDLAWRLNLRGWKCWYAPSAIGYHERGSTRKRVPREARNYYVKGIRNRYIGLFKNLRWAEDVRPNARLLLFQEARAVLGFARRDLASMAIVATALWQTLRHTVLSARMRAKRRFIHAGLRDDAFGLDFRSAAESPLEINLHDSSPRTTLGPERFAAREVGSRNLRGRLDGPLGGALAGGVSTNTDPSFEVKLMPGVEGCRYLEFELYASRATSGRLIWLRRAPRRWRRRSEFCVSESFAIQAGRRRYLIDLEALCLLRDVGTPDVRERPERLRLDPSEEKGVSLGLFTLKLFDAASVPALPRGRQSC